MSKTVHASRTINPLHFEDLEPHRFEDLVRQLAYGFKQWLRLEDRGKLGNDEGKDILGVEGIISELERHQEEEEQQEEAVIIEEREWRFQCKREKQIGPADIRRIVQEAIKSGVPYGLVIAVACNVSDKCYTAFHEERLKHGIKEGQLWTKSRIEDMLFQPENDNLLFAYFGFSLGTRRRSALMKVRQFISTKRKILKAFDLTDFESNSFHADVLLRDVDDDTYFDIDKYVKNRRDPIANLRTVTCVRWNGNAIEAEIKGMQGIYKSDGTWDVHSDGFRPYGEPPHIQMYVDKENRKKGAWELYESIPKDEKIWITVSGFVLIKNVIEVDPLGDYSFPIPHLYCKYDPEEGFFTGGLRGSFYKGAGMHERIILDESLRKNYFTKLIEDFEAKSISGGNETEKPPIIQVGAVT